MNPVRITLAMLLVAAGGWGIHLHGTAGQSPSVPPSSAESTAPDGSIDLSGADREAEERALRERFELYRKLRLQDDFVAMYDLSDPEQRATIDLRTYLSYYGHGMVRFHELRLDSLEFDWPHGEATVTATTNAELLVDKLPSSYRVSMKNGEDDTRIEAPNSFAWVRRGDGQWYLRMDQQIVSGRTADGRGVRALQGQ